MVFPVVYGPRRLIGPFCGGCLWSCESGLGGQCVFRVISFCVICGVSVVVRDPVMVR